MIKVETFLHLLGRLSQRQAMKCQTANWEACNLSQGQLARSAACSSHCHHKLTTWEFHKASQCTVTNQESGCLNKRCNPVKLQQHRCS